MPAMTLDELLDSGEAHARTVLLELKQKQLTPFYVLSTPDDKPDAIVPCEFGDDRDKDFTVALVTSIARAIGAVTVMFVSEAWIASYPPDADLNRVLTPSQQPGRVEAVALVASDGVQTRSRTLAIVRSKSGHITGLAASPADGSITIGGRMIDGIVETTIH